MRQLAAGVLHRNSLESWTKLAPDLYPHQWSWDSACIALGLAHLDNRRATRELETLFAGPWATGKVPHVIFNPDAPPPGATSRTPSGGTPPPSPSTPLLRRTPAVCASCLSPRHSRPAHLATALSGAPGRRATTRRAERARAFLRGNYGGLFAWYRYLASARDPEESGLVSLLPRAPTSLACCPWTFSGRLRAVPGACDPPLRRWARSRDRGEARGPKGRRRLLHPDLRRDHIVEKTVGKLLEAKRPGPRGGASRLKIVDPACSLFLIGAYRYLLDWHRDRYVEDGPEKWSKVLYEGPGGTWHLTIDEKKRILLNNIRGVDINSRAVEVTKLSLLLKVLEGGSESSLATQLRMFQGRALPDLDDNIKCGNSVIGPDFYEDEQMMLLNEEEHYRINVFDWKVEFRRSSSAKEPASTP